MARQAIPGRDARLSRPVVNLQREQNQRAGSARQRDARPAGGKTSQEVIWRLCL